MYIMTKNKIGQTIASIYQRDKAQLDKVIRILGVYFRGCKIVVESSKKTELVLQ
ncbi:MAG: hypothetical protein UY48_C0008G0015 [Candidatus Gottesmanbacteria bacterium GW2011_GWB1_49_7]|uniref:Uncharacterized protein n=1 Tax=Candidatus Gottesmanbacteria bacterium GW2011_GWB1_49_7 TaxID=1618448 RepID=A0A0G1W2N6_9BACT|nr:MAG: hypothetical protein UY48_C0008G0015 [Candidatus Gottesmanbacteria bacterium GW2011_GWB1_49_7]